MLAASLMVGAQVEGTVKLKTSGAPMQHITVLLLPTGRVVESNEEGKFSFTEVAAGKYTLVAVGEGLSADRRSLELKENETAKADIEISVTPIRQEMTVTASAGKTQTFLETFTSTLTLDATALANKSATSLGDVLDGEAGIHRRSSGPGSTRPVIRGFDGDRVLILQDGVRTGTLGAQSGDHGEPVDPQSLDRVEVVRGPNTLLYGSSAIGGVVNMVSGHHEALDQGHRGVHGYLSGIGGTNNGLHGTSAGLDFGVGRFVFRVGSGGQRTSDYRTPEERIFNSRSRTYNGNTGLSYYGKQNWFTTSFNSQRANYQLPTEPGGDEVVSLPLERWNLRWNGGQRDRYQYSVNYSNYKHAEIANGELETEFFNKQLDYRFLVEQPKRGPWSGSFGVWGLRRDYKAQGAEAISPPTIQNAFAGYGVETLNMERVRLQFGGRVETNRYKPQFGRERNFTGFSGSTGVSVPIDNSSVVVANYSLAYRAPAIEELYANGPHPGLGAFEIGDSNLERERMNGLDFSYRRQDGRIKTELNYFNYWLNGQVFLAPTGRIEDGLPEARYRQGNSNYTGFDGRVQAGLKSWAWMHVGFDSVRTELRATGISLPRTPPVRGRVGMDFLYKNVSVAPEVVIAATQDRVFTNETPTDGYATANLRGGYTLVRQHTIHFFGANWHNANNRLYRNHLSFIKAYAPEMGRAMVFNYSVRFF